MEWYGAGRRIVGRESSVSKKNIAKILVICSLLN